MPLKNMSVDSKISIERWDYSIVTYAELYLLR